MILTETRHCRLFMLDLYAQINLFHVKQLLIVKIDERLTKRIKHAYSMAVSGSKTLISTQTIRRATMADIQELKDSLAKFTSSINEPALAKMQKTYALVMSKQDSRNVSCTDAAEKSTVRENFLKKKLGLTKSDADLDAAVEAICLKMKDDRLKNRLVFYYLLAEHFNLLGNFTA